MTFFDDKTGEATVIEFFREGDSDLIVEIDRESDGNPWTPEGIAGFQKNRGGIFVAWSKVDGRRVASGYLMFRRMGSNVAIIDVAVRKTFRRHGIGSRLVCKLARMVNLQQTRRIGCTVKEHDVAMQCFLRSLGFLMTNTLKFKDTGDCYSFEFQLPQPAECEGR